MWRRYSISAMALSVTLVGMARLPRIDLPGISQHIIHRGNNRLPCFLDDGNRVRYLHLLHDAMLATGCQLHAYVLMNNHVHLLAMPPEAGGVGKMMQRAHSALTPHPSWLALGNALVERSSAYRALPDEALPGELLADIRIHLQQQRALGHDAFRAMVEAKAHRYRSVGGQCSCTRSSVSASRLRRLRSMEPSRADFTYGTAGAAEDSGSHGAMYSCGRPASAPGMRPNVRPPTA